MMFGASVVDGYGVMCSSWVVRVGDVSDFLVDIVVLTVMRITDMSHWSMGLSDMMANMRGLNMVSLRSFSFVLLRLFLLSKHQVMNWLIMVHSNWLEDDFVLRSFFTVSAMMLIMTREIFIYGLRITVMESGGLNRCLHHRLDPLMMDICSFMA